MIPYYIMVVVPYFLSLVFRRQRYEDNMIGRKVTISSFFLIFLLLLCFRDIHCGTDLIQYEKSFLNVQVSEWGSGFELAKDKGYFIFQKLTQYLTDEFYTFLAIIAILTVTGLWYFYNRESENAVLTIALFLSVAPFTMFFSGLRQAFAMAFVVPAWYAAKNKKFLLFALSVVIAGFLHHSAWFIALILPLYYIKLTKKSLFFVVPAMGLVLAFNKPLFQLAVKFLGDRGYEMSDTGAYTVLILLILFLVYSFVILDDSKLDRDIIALRNILILAVFIQCFAPVHTLVMRINYYFLLFIPILIPKIARRAKYEFAQIAEISVIVMTVFFTFWFFNEAHNGTDILQVFPYSTWLFEK